MEQSAVKESKKFITLGVVQNKAGEVLMIRRKKKEVGAGGVVLEWAFPGGKQWSNESREESVRREVLAETGYDVKPLRQISLRVHPQFPIIIVYFLCALNTEKSVAPPTEPHEVEEIKWIKPQDIPSIVTTDLDPKVKKELSL